jgi:ecotin
MKGMNNAAAKLFVLLAAWLPAVTLAQAGKDDLKPFPAAGAGRQRIVNRHSFGGTVTREEAKGWGFSYYVLDGFGAMTATRMACPPGTPLHEEFARVPAQMLAALRYNSRVPIVIYVPSDAQVRYRIWSAGSEIVTAGAE